MDLNWCDFHVLVYKLSLNKMNLGIVTHIGNRLSKFREMDMDDTGCAWSTVLRMRVSLEVNLPMKIALQIRTMLGEAHMVTFSYERLTNFCYLYGRLGHISKFCELQFNEGFIDPGMDTPYCPWLRAPFPTHNTTTYSKTTSDAKGSASQAKGKHGGSIFSCFGAASWTGEPTTSGRVQEGQAKDVRVGPNQVRRGKKLKDNNRTDSDDAVVEGPPIKEAAWQNLTREQGGCTVIPNDIDTSDVVTSTFQEHVLDWELQVVHSGPQNQMELDLDLV
ncbi:UNVERIFIED_CONTAM: hypothetical protein Sradi_3831900 [Sesamum radiatum]|uniref:Zinc knuckle CX2CX4HX4C domain-containing protein n=1 Tax=Sesamum radiatum TaxID=300843 RepID=A0AAW2Q1B0_SESRA